MARDVAVVAALVLFAVGAGRVHSATQDLRVLGEAMTGVGEAPGGGTTVAYSGLRYGGPRTQSRADPWSRLVSLAIRASAPAVGAAASRVGQAGERC